MKKNLTLALAMAALMLGGLQKTKAQNWKYGGNATTTDTTLGTSNNHALRIVTNGVEGMRISADGKVGIGTKNPSSTLHVVGTTAINGMLTLGPNKSIQFANSVSPTSPMIYLFKTGTANPNRMVLAHSSSYPDWGLQYNDNLDQFDFLGAGSSKLAINLSNGNIGVGTTTPTNKLHVVGNQTLEGNLTFTQGTQFIQFANPGTAPSPMMYMFTSGTVNTDRMVIAHSPSYPSWGLRYSDLSDDFDFLSNGTSVMRVDLSSQYVGIGTTSPAYKLDVCGTIRAKEVRVETGWCDYVFEKDYKLRSIQELENYINTNKHLPGIAPASEVEKNGLKIAEMNKAMMEKIEELTLYVIQLSKDNKKLQAEVEALKK